MWGRMRKMLGQGGTGKNTAPASSAHPPQGACERLPLARVQAATGHWAPYFLLATSCYCHLYRALRPSGGEDEDEESEWVVKRRVWCKEEFQEEVSEMAHKEHPNLLPVVGYCDEQGEQLVVYQLPAAARMLTSYCRGTTSTPLSLQQRLAILIGVARGLDYLHSFGIVCCGLCPSDIFLHNNMRVKIGGFDSVATSLPVAFDSVAAESEVRAYLDPDMRRTHIATKANDLYSLGVVLLQLLSGRHPVTAEASGTSFTHWVEVLLRSNHVTAILDPTIVSSLRPLTTTTVTPSASTSTGTGTPSGNTPSTLGSSSGSSSSSAVAPPATPAPIPSVPMPSISIPGMFLSSIFARSVSEPSNALPRVMTSIVERLARIGLACTAVPIHSRPSVGRILADLEILRDDLAQAQQTMEEEREEEGGGHGETDGGSKVEDQEHSHLEPMPLHSLSPPPPPPPPPPPAPPYSIAPPSSSAPPFLLAPVLCQQLSLAQVEQATNGWAKEKRIGSGGFADVYWGVSPLDGVTPWAVKRGRVFTNDFRREVNEMASKQHPHLVRLLGFCMACDAGSGCMEQITVYELMHGGDLLHRLKAEAAGDCAPLSLQQRLAILIGVARGLDYLHSFGIVHRDVKPGNVLLDGNMQAKLADFGLLKVDDGSSTVQSTRVMGTPGYVDPTYSLTHKATPSADVYSFGVLMLEVLSGKPVVLPCADGSHTNLKDWVAQQYASGDSGAALNPCLNAPDPLASELIRISLACVAKLTSERPSMSQVLVALDSVKREYVGGRKERTAKKLDEQVQASRRPSRPLEEELEIIRNLHRP